MEGVASGVSSAGHAASAGGARARPIYLEFRNICVQVKAKQLADKKPPRIHIQQRPNANSARAALSAQSSEHAETKTLQTGTSQLEPYVQTQPQALLPTVSPPLPAASISPPLALCSSSTPLSFPISYLPPLPRELPTPPEFSFQRPPPCSSSQQTHDQSMAQRMQGPSRMQPHVESQSAPAAMEGNAASQAQQSPQSQSLAESSISVAQRPASAPPKSLILDSVSGYALPGQLTVVMGASGSGQKLAYRIAKGHTCSQNLPTFLTCIQSTLVSVCILRQNYLIECSLRSSLLFYFSSLKRAHFAEWTSDSLQSAQSSLCVRATE